MNAFARPNEFSFKVLPDVLVQDPARHCAYLLPASALQSFRVRPEDYARYGSSTVTFVIPDNEYIEQAPPFLSSPDVLPSVLIQFPGGEAAYFLTHEQLQQFTVEQPKEHAGYGISFVIPLGMELIEELPAMASGILQSGESGSSTGISGIPITPVVDPEHSRPSKR